MANSAPTPGAFYLDQILGSSHLLTNIDGREK
jgi:hypothetical protein